MVYKVEPELPELVKRLELLSENIEEDNLLINVIYRILERMKTIYSVQQLHFDIEKLEFATNVSRQMCKLIVENEHIIQTLFYSFNGLNRSEPHKKVIFSILTIFLNLFHRTNSSLLYCKEMLEVVFRTFRNFTKSNAIISKILGILVYLLHEKQTLKVIYSLS